MSLFMIIVIEVIVIERKRESFVCLTAHTALDS